MTGGPFAGKVALVTGGASGIGAATVEAFADWGATTAALDIAVDAGAALADSLASPDRGTVLFHRLDVTDKAGCEAVVATVAAEHGQVDFLVNNAASFISAGLDATDEDWEQSLGVNVVGYAHMVQAAADHMPRGGAVVNVASVSAHVAQSGRWTYNATKGAVVTMTKCQALDLGDRGIRVNAVSPGWIWTPEVLRAAAGDRDRWSPVWGRFHILRRLGEPCEVATAIRFLCSDEASFITGAELAVDGGYRAIGPEGLGDSSTFAGSR